MKITTVRLANFVALAILCLLSQEALSQKKIEYGSNNGKYVSILNTKIYYEEYGKGAPLILLQGGMGGIGDFALCIPELSKHFRVIAPDTPGQGRSALADSMSYPLMAEYISKMLDILKLDSAYIMGWSDGGNMALIVASNRPDKVKKVIASGANYKLNAYPTLVNDSTDWEKVVNDPKWQLENKAWIDSYLKLSNRDWKKMLIDINKMWKREIYFPQSILERIKVPAMIVLGDRDAVTLDHGLEMYRLIKGGSFCVVPNTSHAVFHERPALINKIAINFFLR